MVRAAGAAGARWIGFMLVPESPRAVTLEEAAALAREAEVKTVAVVVDRPFKEACEIARAGFDALQFHGSEEPDYLADIKNAFPDTEVWKALGVSSADDLKQTRAYYSADRLLLDAKPPQDADRAGGHGEAFDWSILKEWTPPKPWLLAGGLNPGNVADAIRATNAPAVDVSSGVEAERGVKDAELIKAFIDAAKSA